MKVIIFIFIACRENKINDRSNISTATPDSVFRINLHYLLLWFILDKI